MLFAFIFIFGIIIGSFINVLIYRLPREMSLILPHSHCPHCQKPVRWYENVPLFAYLYLRGRCSQCKERISPRYFCVELLCGLVALYLGHTELFGNYGVLLFFFKFFVFALMLTHFFIDLEHQILPDSLNIALGVLFLAYSLYFNSWGFWLFGALVGAGFPMLVTWGFYLLRGQIGLGGGDIKLYGVLGLYLGAIGVIHTIFLSCFVGSLYGMSAILLKKMDKTKPIAFGPFIILVALFQIFFPSFFSAHLIFV